MTTGQQEPIADAAQPIDPAAGRRMLEGRYLFSGVALEVGKGGRDGESIALSVLLERRLEWPE